ncbi:MAG: DNA-binding protein [Ruminococcus sp.]|nr:DNA-binding protein [Ruminococcus sp.]
MNDKWEISLLYDFYGGLLNESQQKVVELYVNSDLSYAESAELLGISRQGVKDALDRATEKLYSYEEKLSLLEQYRKTQDALEGIVEIAGQIRHSTDDEEIKELTREIQSIADSIADKEV